MNILKCLCSCIILLFPVAVSAQSMVVFGGGEYARQCQLNVEIANNLEFGSSGFLEPCNYVLKHVLLEPRDRAATLNNRGVLRYLAQDYEGAFSDFEAADRIMPDSATIRANRGNAFYYTGQLGLALEDYFDALELGISRPHAVHSNMGIVYEQMGNLIEAEIEYQTALELRPGWEKAEMQLENLRRKQQRREAEASAPQQ